MDLQAYKQSGILEAYALGALSAEEAAAVEAKLATHPELRAELEALQEDLRHYAEAYPLTPADALEERIWHAIEAASPKQTASEVEVKPTAQVVPLARSRPVSWARAALWIGLVGSLILNAILWNSNLRKDERIAWLKEHETRQATFFASQISQRDQQLQTYVMMKDMMANPAVHTVRLQNLRNDEERASMVLHDTRNGRVYLAVQKMPTPPPGKQYQLWVMRDGEPNGIAMLPVRPHRGGITNDLQMVPIPVAAGEAFAISIEDIGGSLTPTMDQIVMMGKVAG